MLVAASCSPPLDNIAGDGIGNAACLRRSVARGCVENAFPWEERRTLDNLTLDRVDKTKPSLHWVSKVIGQAEGWNCFLMR